MASGKMDAKSVIYTLSDPQTNVAMYVGTTADTPKVRLNAHFTTAKSANDPKSTWFRGVLARGQHPVMMVIDECSYDDSAEREHYWIAYYRKMNPSLLNVRASCEYLIVPDGNIPPLSIIVNQYEDRRPGRKSTSIATLPLQVRLTPEQHAWITSQDEGASEIVRRWIAESIGTKQKGASLNGSKKS